MHQSENLLNNLLGGFAGNQGSKQNQATKGSGLSSLLNGKAGLATGAVAGGLAGVLLGGKKSKKVAKSAFKLGGAALVGGIAYKAWQNWQNSSTAHQPAVTQTSAPQTANQYPTPLAKERFLPVEPDAKRQQAELLLRAMIAAANADGSITPDEVQEICARWETIGISMEDHAFLSQELANPLDVNALLKEIHCPEIASEVYLVSLMVIDDQNPAETGYLAMLAARLPLEPALIAELNRTARENSAS